MWKVLPVLTFIAFACDISRDVLVHGDPARKPEIAGRSVGGGGYEHQTELRGQLNDAEVSQSSAENLERSSEPPAGKWRSNGEALEPKWRDGDSVPLLPFSHYRSYTRDEVEDGEQEALLATSRRPFKYHYAIDQPDRPRGGRRLPPPDDYNHDVSYQSRDYENPDENYPRKRRRPLKNLQSPTFYEETIDSAASNDGKRGRNILDSSLNDREVTWRYREAFQARPNEYEHEFSDEEYLRPRPRKRRPPQNYEFALANEASSNDRNEELKNFPQYLSKGDENLSMESSNKKRENALELKSLLKMQQEEGSSLSEILQRRNLTLNDLLKGKTDVINALKSRIADESDEYIEEMSRVMSDSLMKLAATVTPPWVSTQPSMFENITIKITTTSDTISDSSQMTNVTDKVSKRLEISTNSTNSVKESEDAEKMTRSAHDASWLRAPTTPLTLSTVITTSTLPPIAINSAEYFLNDESNAESTNDHVTRLESLDEDEIMEFSDFTDFKKGKSSGPPSERIISQQAPLDTESTLSIEQILNPTERTKRVEDRENDQDDDINNNNERKMIRDNGQSVPIGVPTAEDYKTFIEAEYQSDASDPEDNGKQNKDRSSEIDAVVSQVEKKQTADDRKELRDKNHSADYHQVTRLPGERTRTLGNHRDTKRYEEVISEIEPEARAEIFELFASGSAGKRLERLLKSRNMSVEELIALRQRGSSKVHLTEVSKLRMSKPKNHQTLETSNRNNGEIIISLSPTSNSTEHFDESDITERRDAKQEMEETMNRFKDIMSYLHDPFFNKDVENMSMSRLLDLVERDRNTSREMMYPGNDTLNAEQLENSRRTMQIVDLLTTFDSLPFAKDVQQQFETEINNNEHELKVKLAVDNNNASGDNNNVVVMDETEKILRSNDSSEFHAGYVEEIVKEEPNIIDIKTVYDETLSSTNGEEDKKILSKVKPSIIASGAILGVTIVVFMAIFIVCRIRQKQKYTYRNTFSRAVFQGPVMAARKLSNSSSLSAVMVNVVATSTTKRPERTETQESAEDFDSKSDMDNDSLDANDSWETIPDYAK
ncbi:hypothetical protein ALC56_08803 [Trachymyrmex septentrionalis]|uniref:Uncharacterized protein n=1 Tax=Trachymyrmex septentrionalis TaxID=34720 RepID=A0A195F9X1_9HYME|nr:PREDICTED: uncharacterized protein LOC108750759 [Trachymyrmex septentrionalis]KYN37012.1 hypothetical protein ALC56_08803 [Trachymyrmex septentrionalis]